MNLDPYTSRNSAKFTRYNHRKKHRPICSSSEPDNMQTVPTCFIIVTLCLWTIVFLIFVGAEVANNFNGEDHGSRVSSSVRSHRANRPSQTFEGSGDVPKLGEIPPAKLLTDDSEFIPAVEQSKTDIFHDNNEGDDEDWLVETKGTNDDLIHYRNVTFPDGVTRMMTEEGILKRWLFSRYGLHITDRPVLRHTDSVAIDLKFELLRFLHIDDLRGSMAVLGIVVLTWNNPFLAWEHANITQSRITRLALKSGEVWTPLILHLNNVKELNVVDKYGRGRGNMVMELFENGTQLWPPTGIYESSCDLNFTYFPLDRQICTFVFESWLASEFVNLSHASAVIHDERTFISKSQIWEFRNLSATTQTIYYDGNPYSQAWVVIAMRRRHAYYTWNILIPCGSLSLLQLSTFALPPETPERASFSVTVLVAFGILQTIIKAEIPTTSDTVLLVIYVVGQLSIGTLATFYIVVSVGLASYSFPQFPTPPSPPPTRKRSSNNRRQQQADNNSIMMEPLDSTVAKRRAVCETDQSNELTEPEDQLNQNEGKRISKRLVDLLFFQRPILQARTIRIMDAVAFSALAILTFVGHVTVYALLHSASFEDVDDL